jgi:quinol monooxygenase YgiN
MHNRTCFLWPALLMSLGLFLYARPAAAQPASQMVRLAKLVIDSSKLTAYKLALQEEIETSLRVEPGVITLYAVSENKHPNHITILEIYASKAAYASHVLTQHFLKYKNDTKEMVKSLELVETTPLIPGMKPQ